MCVCVCVCRDTGQDKAYGATFVSSRICLSLRSWGSGRVRRCFSRESRRSSGEVAREVVSTAAGVEVGSVDIVDGWSLYKVDVSDGFCTV